MLNVEEIRKDFPMLQGKLNDGMPLIYLDNGATTFKPQSVIDKVMNYYCNETANVHRGDYDLSQRADEDFEHVREIVGNFINCKPQEVVFTSGASSALNLVAYGYGCKYLKQGDIILSTEAEHASDILPWYRVAEQTGAKVVFIPFDEEGKITIDNFKSVMNENVKMVALAAVSNVLGYLNPIKEICRIAHEYGALVSVDGAQSVPHVKTDVQDLGCDFLSFSAHKLCGPTGIGVLYGRYDLLEKMDPTVLGGGSNARFDNCGNIMLKNTPWKFEAGTQPIEGALGMGAAIEYIEKIGMDNIEEYEKYLRNYLLEKLTKLDNVKIYNPTTDTGIVAFNVYDRGKMIFAQDAAAYLSKKGICLRSGNHCAKILVDFLKTSATIRCSVYFYNTTAEIDALIEALKTTTLENCIDTIF